MAQNSDLARIDGMLAEFNKGKPDGTADHQFSHSRWCHNISVADGEAELGYLLNQAAMRQDVHQFHRSEPEAGLVTIMGWTAR